MWKSRAATQAKIMEILLRARAFPPDHDDRWTVVSELEGVRPGPVVDTACDLLSSGDPAEMTLGAQIADVVCAGPAANSTILRIGLRVRRRRLRALIRDVCHPGQAPEVLAMALGPYAMTHPGRPEYFLPFAGHEHAQVRARAVWLLARETRAGGSAISERVSLLINTLQEDPDPDVAAEASNGLRHLADLADLYDDAPALGRIKDSLRRYREDPRPSVRINALLTTLGDVSTVDDLRLMARELEDPAVHWEFVSTAGVLGWSALGDAGPAQVVAALTRLRDQGWTRQVVPGAYPYENERARILNAAIDQVCRDYALAKPQSGGQ